MQKEKIIELKELIEEEEKIAQEIADKREEFIHQNSELFDKTIMLNEKIKTSKAMLSDDALVEFQKNGEKKLLGGIGIRVGAKLIYEETKAFEWAKQHAMALQLDKRAFEKIVKADPTTVSFVESEEKITVTFPKEIKVD